MMGQRDATLWKPYRQPLLSHCVFFPSEAVVIVSGWGKQFLQRFPETLMEVRFNLCPIEMPLPCIDPSCSMLFLRDLEF